MATVVFAMHQRSVSILRLYIALVLLGLALSPHPARAAGWLRRLRSWVRQPSAWVKPSAADPPLNASSQESRQGVVLFQRNILERVYANSRPRAGERVTEVVLQAARSDYEPAQIAVLAVKRLRRLHLVVSDLTDDSGDILPAAQIEVRMVRYYGAALNFGRRRRFSVVPKTLETAVPIDIPASTTRPYWITLHTAADQPGGTYRGTIRFESAVGTVSLPLVVHVIAAVLDEPDILYGPLCINSLANLWKVQTPSAAGEAPPAPWGGPNAPGAAPAGGKVGRAGRRATILEQADIVFRDHREHGMNCVSLRAGTEPDEVDGHPYLADLEAAIPLYRRYQFPQPLVYCAGSLLKTSKGNRAASYREFEPEVDEPLANQVATYYTQRFRDEGLPGIVFMPVEEPNLKTGVAPEDPPDARQKIARRLTRSLHESGVRLAVTCTPESVAPLADDVGLWIVAYRRFAPQIYSMAAAHHANLALYANATTMGQGTYFTRFMFGYFVWANHLNGMLPWTYPLQPKRFPVNVSGAGEGPLDVHDGFLGADGKPVPTIQWELAREGIDDIKYLTTIEHLQARAQSSGEDAASQAASAAQEFLKRIRQLVVDDPRHYRFEDEKTFEPMPQDGWDGSRFDALRREAGDLLRQLLLVTLPADQK